MKRTASQTDISPPPAPTCAAPTPIVLRTCAPRVDGLRNDDEFALEQAVAANDSLINPRNGFSNADVISIVRAHFVEPTLWTQTNRGVDGRWRVMECSLQDFSWRTIIDSGSVAPRTPAPFVDGRPLTHCVGAWSFFSRRERGYVPTDGNTAFVPPFNSIYVAPSPRGVLIDAIPTDGQLWLFDAEQRVREIGVCPLCPIAEYMEGADGYDDMGDRPFMFAFDRVADRFVLMGNLDNDIGFAYTYDDRTATSECIELPGGNPEIFGVTSFRGHATFVSESMRNITTHQMDDRTPNKWNILATLNAKKLSPGMKCIEASFPWRLASIDSRGEMLLITQYGLNYNHYQPWVYSATADRWRYEDRITIPSCWNNNSGAPAMFMMNE